MTRPPFRPGGGEAGRAWNIIGTLLAGTVFWGLVGFGLDRLLGFRAVFLPIGVVVGMGGALYLVIHKLGRE